MQLYSAPVDSVAPKLDIVKETAFRSYLIGKCSPPVCNAIVVIRKWKEYDTNQRISQ